MSTITDLDVLGNLLARFRGPAFDAQDGPLPVAAKRAVGDQQALARSPLDLARQQTGEALTSPGDLLAMATSRS